MISQLLGLGSVGHTQLGKPVGPFERGEVWAARPRVACWLWRTFHALGRGFHIRPTQLQRTTAIDRAGGAGAPEMDPDVLSKAFVELYYSTFDTNRGALVGLYEEASMLTFEDERVLGGQAISTKLNGLCFQQCKHLVSTVDCQPSGPAGGMVVFVTGNLQLPDEEHLLKFAQMFHLLPTSQGSFYVLNDIFRLIYS